MATLIAHTKFIDPAIGQLLEDLRSYETAYRMTPMKPASSASLSKTMKSGAHSPSFTAKFSQHSTESYEAWAKARTANDFAAVQPYLEKTLDLSRELANLGYEHIADPLIDEALWDESYDRAICLLNCDKLVSIVEAITSQPIADASCLHQNFPS